MPRKKRVIPVVNSESEVEMSGNESEVSVTEREVPNRETTEDEHDHEHESDECSDMDLGQCETRRTELMKDLQELENQFNCLKEQLFKERIQQVDKQIQGLKDGTSPQYVAQIKLLDLERRSRIDVAGILREERLENLNNQYEAEKLAALQNFENDKKLAYETCHEEMMETIRQLEEDKRNSEIVWGEGSKWDTKKQSTTRAKKAVTVSGPYIVYMLKPEEIMEDWTAIRKACQDL